MQQAEQQMREENQQELEEEESDDVSHEAIKSDLSSKNINK